MKINSVELHPNNSSSYCALSFRDPTRQNPFSVKSITGLDAESITPKYYGMSKTSSSFFYNLLSDKRNIVITIGLNPDFTQNETYSSLRDILYKIIASSRTGLVEIQFKNGTTVEAVISGWVTKFETAHFDKDPQVIITISTTEPMLMAPNPTIVDLTGRSTNYTTIRDAESTAPHGFTFELKVVAVTSDSLKIEDTTDDSWSFEIVPPGGFVQDDYIHFSSERNGKTIYKWHDMGVSGIVTTYLADCVTLGSIWPILFPGDNYIAVTDHPLNYQWHLIQYNNTYWGI
jgi:hypothetical protein